jgi:molybdopterin-containing oxidoreductase family membrane subunit
MNEKKKSTGLLAAIVICAVVAIIGIVLWVVQQMGALGGSNLDPWGLYIACFIFFAGLAAGSMAVAAIPAAFGLKGYGNLSKLACWIAISATIAAGFMIVIDLGQPLRVFEMIFSGNFTSPLMWDMYSILLFLIVGIVFQVNLVGAAKKDKQPSRALAIIALAFGVLVVVVEAWIFATNQSHALWNSALLAPWFIVSAVVSGFGFALIAACIANKTGMIKLADGQLKLMAKILGVFLIADFVFSIVDLFQLANTGTGQYLAVMVSGAMAPAFWIDLICVVVAAIISLAPQLRKPVPLAAAGVLAVVAAFLLRVQIVFGGFGVANITAASLYSGVPVDSAMNHYALQSSALIAAPDAFELLTALCMIGLMLFVIFLGVKLMPLGDAAAKKAATPVTA